MNFYLNSISIIYLKNKNQLNISYKTYYENFDQ